MVGCFSGFSRSHKSNSNSAESPPPVYDKSMVPNEVLPDSTSVASHIIEDTIDGLDDELRELSLEIWNHPEIALQEHHTHDVLVTFMRSHGFTVTPHAYGMDTAFKAEFTHNSSNARAKDQESRTIGYNSEMDALPTIGHGCGHNLIAIVGVGSAIATAKALKKHNVSGRVILLGTPAEEAIGGKIELIKQGAYKTMDVCLMAHGAPHGFSGLSTPWLAILDVHVEYTGRGAHSAGAPWKGINALDAAVLAYTNVSALRQQMHPEERVHGVIRDPQGWAANIVPASSALEYGIRSPSLAGLNELKKRVFRCFEAAAEATGCEVKIKEDYAYYEVRNCSPLADEYTRYMEERGKRKQHKDLASLGSTDFGNVCYELPAIHPTFDCATPDGIVLHTKEFRDHAGTPEAHKEALIVAKGLATTGYRAATDPDFLKSIQAWYARDKKERQAPPS